MKKVFITNSLHTNRPISSLFIGMIISGIICIHVLIGCEQPELPGASPEIKQQIDSIKGWDVDTTVYHSHTEPVPSK